MASNPLDYIDSGYDYYDVEGLFRSVAGALSTLTPESAPRFLERAKKEITDLSLKQAIIASDLSRPIDKNTKAEFRNMLNENLEGQWFRQGRIDAFTEQYFTEVNDGGLSDLGRNYQPSLDFFHSVFLSRVREGIEITPKGIAGIVSVYPTENNPTGRMRFPIENEYAPIVKSNSAYANLPLKDIFDQRNDDWGDQWEEIAKSNSDAIILREAYCLRSLSNIALLHRPKTSKLELISNNSNSPWTSESFETNISDRVEATRQTLESVDDIDKCDDDVRSLVPDIIEMTRRLGNWAKEMEQGNYRTASILAKLYFDGESMNGSDRDSWKVLEQATIQECESKIHPDTGVDWMDIS